MEFAAINSLLKLRHTLFGLPFALAGAILPFALYDDLAYPWQRPVLWVYVVVAFVSARTAGMAFNEACDHNFDAINPRTQHRVIPSGLVAAGQAVWIAWASLLLFLIVCSQINPLVFALSPLAALLIWGYAYTKRFTAYTHYVLGGVQFLGPVMAWAAVTGSLALPPFMLGGAVLCLIAASDILYAVQDREFDRQNGLRSVPARLGWKGALRVARITYCVSVLFLILVGVTAHLAGLYYMGVGGAGGIMLAAQRRISYDRPAEFPPGFFAVNAQVAVLVLLAIIGALLWPELL